MRRPVLLLVYYWQVGETIFSDLTVKVFAAAFLLSSGAAGVAGFSVPVVPIAAVGLAKEPERVTLCPTF